jgi:tetratricopeptide (TPR) repeat protein
MYHGPARGLPPRITIPIVFVGSILILALILNFLKTGLGVTGAALGPSALQSEPPATSAPMGVAVPQSGVAAPGNGVGGGTAAPAGGGPPAPIQRLLTELKGRVLRNPRDREALLGLAQLYSDAGKFAQALPYYRRTLALDPSNPQTRLDYASALHANGDDPAARAELRRILASKPNFAPARAALKEIGS